jgi:ribonuclease Z
MTFVVTLTGTGVPLVTPGRAGAGVLVQAGETTLQFDAGRSTTLRLAEAGVQPSDLDALFLTHHHSDHCVDVDDLVIARWVVSGGPLVVVAPDGPLTQFGATFLAPWADDIAIRREVTGRGAIEVDWRSFPAAARPEVVWEGAGVTVSSVAVEHAPVAPAVAYRVDYEGGAVVISGDTRVCAAVADLAQGVDVLVHEVCLPDAFPQGADLSVIDYHADAQALGALAERARVGTLILTHLLPAPQTPEAEERYVQTMRQGGFMGDVVVGHDLYSLTVSTDAAAEVQR